MKKFLTVITLLSFSLIMLGAGSKIPSPRSFFENGYFTHKTIDISGLRTEKIKAKIDGQWSEYKLSKFPKKFMKWNVRNRLKSITDIEQGKRPRLSGPHNGIVATYGTKRDDTFFQVNNAVKGMGFLPKREKMKEILKLLRDTHGNPIAEKLKILKSLYNRASEIFDLSAQVSLELYSKPEFITQTFFNQALNPISTVVYLDIPSFKFKAITLLIDEANPNLSDYEKDIVAYSNEIHSYFHGEFQRQFIAVVYYAVEIYDNSPGRSDAMGRRIVPMWP